jgi:hypothetical protein
VLPTKEVETASEKVTDRHVLQKPEVDQAVEAEEQPEVDQKAEITEVSSTGFNVVQF